MIKLTAPPSGGAVNRWAFPINYRDLRAALNGRQHRHRSATPRWAFSIEVELFLSQTLSPVRAPSALAIYHPHPTVESMSALQSTTDIVSQIGHVR
jgi:hypothetical protein